MSIASNLYAGSAAWGKLQGMFCCVVMLVLGCVVSVGGVVSVNKDDKKDVSRRTKTLTIATMCSMGLCIACIGLCFFYATQKSKGFAAVAGVGDLIGAY